MNQEIVQLAFELCQIPSITFNEMEVAHFLSRWLTKMGFTVEKIPVTGSSSRFNIWSYGKKQQKYLAIFCTHIDTVAPFVVPRIDKDGEVLWGRGACDAKGIAAAMIFAVLTQKARGFHDLGLLFTVGEEEASDGAKASNEVLKDRAHFVVIGEPTELSAASAQKGTVVFDLESYGCEAHSALPHLGDSAVHRLIGDISRLIAYPWHQNMEFGETFINIGEIRGGHARNMIANSCHAKGIMRTSVPTI